MRKKQADKESFKATLLAVQEEMARPTRATSARGLEIDLEARMAKEKGTNGVDAPEEAVTAFEAGIVFGRMVENRRPRTKPLWSEEEWLQALIKVVGTKAESKVREWNAGLNGDGQQRDG